MGSRYGGLKQIDPVDHDGDLIIDFSIFDAKEAGFEKVVFIIKKAIEKDFREHIGNRMEKHIQVEYVYQENDLLPEGYQVPENRVKPWGTGHAILCCKDVIDGPFAVINADDYYGKAAFKELYRHLCETEDNDRYQYAMVGYKLYNTLTENGHVSRGVCVADNGASWTYLPEDTLVSMNMWGFTSSILEELEKRFTVFLDQNLPVNPEKCEYFLPFVVDELLKEDKAQVTVLKSADKWYGVTYKEDKPMVMDAIQGLKDSGYYPKKLWED